MTGLTLHNCLILSAALVGIGIFGVLTRRSLLFVLLSVEIMLNGIHISLIAFNYFRWSGVEYGHYLYMLSIAVAAVEAAVGLSMVIVLFRRSGGTSVESVRELGEKK